MKWNIVHLPVCPTWTHSSRPLLWDWQARDIDRLLQQQWVIVGNATLLAYVGS